MLRRVLLSVLLIGLVAAAVWAVVYRRDLDRQWRLYRISAAATPAAAEPYLAWFDAEPERAAKLQLLTAKWGTGSPQFDQRLAEYLVSPQADDALRAALAAEFDAREAALDRWTWYWRWQAPQSPNEQIASVLAYVGTLATAPPPGTLTWRDVLDLQAAWAAVGHRWLARGLTPENWRQRWQTWQETKPAELPHVVRPDRPMPDR